ncbi:MAG TPA: hypothetical protein VFZ89_19090, partial [Solirubrobacteraceae bacterium]
AGHSAVVLERDAVAASDTPEHAFDPPRRGIPHFLQPHAFLPRGRRELQALAPDVLDTLVDAGADPQDLADKLNGPREAGDEDLVYFWVRRPLIEWALRRAAARAGVELRPATTVSALLTDGGRATGVALDDGERVTGEVVVDALGRYRTPPGWPRPHGTPSETAAVYYCRYFRLAEDAAHLDWPLLNPRGDLGYMGFNVFRGDNRTYAIILLAPAADHTLRVLRHEPAWMATCAAIHPLDVITSPDHGTPITGVMPMGGLMNVDRTGDPGVARLVAVGDAFCHTDPAFAWGLSFALIHARALAEAATAAPDDVGDRYRAAAGDESRERHRVACAIDDARARRWAGEPLDVAHRDGCYPLFAFTGALAAAPHDDHVLRRAIGRIGLLDRTRVFDDDTTVHTRIEAILEERGPPPPPGPPRDELLARLS